jgi:dTDP-4-dehydrorhamnose 3,5-epimerase
VGISLFFNKTISIRMDKFNAIDCRLPGVKIIKTKKNLDSRGSFSETFRNDYFYDTLGFAEFIQENEALSRKGVLRGLHFQTGGYQQAKLLRVIEGEIFDVVVDLREGSETWGQWESFLLNSKSGEYIYVPRGFAHGYLCLSQTSIVQYKVDNYYAPNNNGGIYWGSELTNGTIEWPEIDTGEYIVSDLDKKLPRIHNGIKM